MLAELPSLHFQSPRLCEMFHYAQDVLSPYLNLLANFKDWDAHSRS